MDWKYSTDGESFNYDDIESAFEMGAQVGDTATIYVGEPVSFKASYFCILDCIEDMSAMAHDNVGEYTDDWPDCTSEQEKELVDGIKAAVDLWADKHGKHPTFYGIKNSRAMTIKLLENGEYEEVLSA